MDLQQTVDYCESLINAKLSFFDGRSESYADHPIVVLANNVSVLTLARQVVAAKADKDESAFFVMDMGRVDTLVDNWQRCMPKVQPFYTLRCNGDPVLLQLLTKRNVGLSCSNRAELDVALKYVDRDRLVYCNPLWTRANIRHARSSGVRLVVVETEDDMNRFAANFSDARIILRVMMDPPLEANAFNISGPDVEQASKLLHKAAELGIKIVGIRVSVRVGAPSPAIYAYSVAQARRLFDIGREAGHEMIVLDVGGGFPGSESAKGASFFQISTAFTEAVKEFFTSEAYAGLQVIAEPGSYFAASPYALVTRVIKKHVVDAQTLTKDQKDGGTIGHIYQVNEGFYGAFGCTLITHNEPECRPLSDLSCDNTGYAAVIGPTLNPLDVVLKLARLPISEVDDWLIWNDMGAHSMGNSGHLGNEVLPVPLIHYFVESNAWSRLSSIASTAFLSTTSCHDTATDQVGIPDLNYPANDQITIKEMV